MRYFWMPMILCASPLAAQADWPQFRGPNGAGVTGEKGLPLTWNARRNIVWKTDLAGPGASSPIVWGEHVYLTCHTGYGLDKGDPGDPKNLKRHLVSVNRADGRIAWTATVPSSGNVGGATNFVKLHGYASSTPVADETGVYVFFATSGVHAYTHAGKPRWHTSLGNHVGPYGSASSPILNRDLVIVNAHCAGRALFALDKETGKVRWTHDVTVEDAYVSPVVARLQDRDELLFYPAKGVLGAVDPRSGRKLWECQVPLDGYQTPLPVVQDGVAFVMGGFFRSAAVRLGGRGDVTKTHKLWELRRGANVMSPVCHDGHLFFAHDNSGLICCVNIRSGKIVYEERLPGDGRVFYASPIVADGRIYFTSREHGAFVLAAAPQFKLLAHNTIETDTSVFNGTPAVSHGHLFLRSDRCLYCIGEAK